MTVTDGSSTTDGGDALREQVLACIVGKAYIAVLKHQLAGQSSGKSLREVFDQAYREGLALARCEPSDAPAGDAPGFSRPGQPPC